MKRFRRQKTLHEVATFLQAKGVDVSGCSGLDAISAALSEYQGAAPQSTKEGKWAHLAEFVNRPAAFAAHQATMKDRRAVVRAEKKRKGASAEFYDSNEWMRLRYEVLRERGAQCECCGATRADGVVIQVDHVKPRSLFPELALVKSNLQVLCRPCNLGKSNRDSTDWRDGATVQ